MPKILNIEDLRRSARRRLPAPMFHYMDGGADDEITLVRNSTAFDLLPVLPRYLVDVADVDTRATMLGQSSAMPLMLAPTGMSRLFHPDGERAVSAAAAEAGLIYSLSTMGSTNIEQVAAACSGAKCFQLYGFRDRGLTRELLDRAKAAGFVAACLTVDVPFAGNREREFRTGFVLPPKLGLMGMLDILAHPRWLARHLTTPSLTLANVSHRVSAASSSSVVSLAAYINSQFDPSLSWRDVEWIVDHWNGPFAIKGLLHPDDAARACEIGASAVVVSNHGGRQFDGAAASVEALPAIVDRVAGRAEIILDGGIRRGNHIVKALALGATGCMIGRPYLYGLAAGGKAGVAHALSILATEFRRAMQLCGAQRVADIGPNLLAPPYLAGNAAVRKT